MTQFTTRELSDLQDAVKFLANKTRESIKFWESMPDQVQIADQIKANSIKSWTEEAIRFEQLSNKIDTILTEV